MMLIFKKNGVFKKKLFVGYKHIRLKFSTQVVLNCNKSNFVIKTRVKKLAEILDCTPYTAQKVVSQNNEILSIPNDCFVRNVEFCSKHFKFSEIIEFPLIITLNSSLLQHRYFSLLELGCSSVTARNIFKFPQILKESPRNFKQEGIVFSADYYLDKCMCLLENDSSSDFKSRLKRMYEDGSNLWKIKEAMNAEYLGSKLECSLFKVHQMFKKYPPLRVQSILNTNQLLDVLVQTFHLPISKMLYVPNLLSLHPEIAEVFISEIPTILGIDTIRIIHKLPLLLRRTVNSIRKIENILRDFHISDSQLMCCPKILNFTPTTLQQRLESLCSSADFALLKSYKKFLWLVYHYNNVSPRLLTLKQHNIPFSISMFTVTKSHFDKYLYVSQCRTYIKDICFYLAGAFGISEGDILLRLKQYPNVQTSSIDNCHKVVEFLSEAGVTKEQILNGVGVVFYNIDTVKMYFKNLQNQPDCQPFAEWRNHFNLIQLLIYKIEADVNNRGETMYKVSGQLDDLDELDASKQYG